MKICSNCGYINNSDEIKFCPKCGDRISENSLKIIKQCPLKTHQYALTICLHTWCILSVKVMVDDDTTYRLKYKQPLKINLVQGRHVLKIFHPNGIDITDIDMTEDMAINIRIRGGFNAGIDFF